MVPLTGLEPVLWKPERDFKSRVSTNSTIAASIWAFYRQCPGLHPSGGQSSELELLHTIIGKILLWIIYIVLATYQPRGQPLGLDHSPQPLIVDFVKLCGLRMKSVGTA